MQLSSIQSDLISRDNIEKKYSRRRFLRAGLGVTTALFLPEVFAGQSSQPVTTGLTQPERQLSLYNTHTGEELSSTYWVEGEYQSSELKAIDYILRDHRTDDVIQMDNTLLDLLYTLHQAMGGKQPFQVISGYRSPETNAALRMKSNGVAKQSLHMEGKAIDIRLPGCELSDLRKAALDLQAGGVGYYPESEFIHIDTGRVRHWG